MAHAKEEVAEMVSAAGALVLNPGTLTPEWVEAMLIAGKRANELAVPVIYDPVGVGATKLRNETGQRFLDLLKLAAVRGNSGEVGALAGAGGVVKGVESVEGVKDPVKVAQELAARYHTVVAITGKRDIISNGQRVLGVDNGHPMLKTITGTGCMATTVVAIFCAVESDYTLATTAALACYGLAAERAAKRAKAPGSFRSALLDALYRLTPAQVRLGTKVIELAK
jgi:hydroxyethylthiazole kinase